jgi:hypothetical protein
MPKSPILLTEALTPPPALVRAGLETLPAIIRNRGERASRRFIEFFTASIRNRNTRAAYMRARLNSSSTGARTGIWSSMTSMRSR